MPEDIVNPNTRLLRRLGAIIYDTLLLFAVLIIAGVPAVLLAGGQVERLQGPLYSLYLYGVSFVFFGWFWTHGGQTLGMKTWKLRLETTDGVRLDWQQALWRYLAATLSNAPLLLMLFLYGVIRPAPTLLWVAGAVSFMILCLLWGLFDRQRLTLHDRLSKTRIIHEKNPPAKS